MHNGIHDKGSTQGNPHDYSQWPNFRSAPSWKALWEERDSAMVQRALLLAFRRARFASQKEAAEYVGCHKSTWVDWEEGKHLMRGSWKRKLIGLGLFSFLHFGEEPWEDFDDDDAC